MKKISVVTVCYNSENEIEETICSVLNQKYSNYEYIIIDGKSKDKTFDKIKNIVNGHNNENLTIISEEDAGIYDAMNKAICLSQSEWIIFINSGDLLSSNEILNKIERNLDQSYDVVYGNIIASDKRFGKKIRKPLKLELLKETMPFCHQAILIKTSIMKKYKFETKYKICADYNLFYNLYKSNYNFKYIDEVISIYDTGGVSSNILKNNIEKYKINKKNKVLYSLFKGIIKNNIKKILPKQCLYRYEERIFRNTR